VDDSEVMVVEVVERVEDLFCVSLDHPLMQWTKLFILGLEGFGHEFHED